MMLPFLSAEVGLSFGYVLRTEMFSNIRIYSFDYVTFQTYLVVNLPSINFLIRNYIFERFLRHLALVTT